MIFRSALVGHPAAQNVRIVTVYDDAHRFVGWLERHPDGDTVARDDRGYRMTCSTRAEAVRLLCERHGMPYTLPRDSEVPMPGGELGEGTSGSRSGGFHAG